MTSTIRTHTDRYMWAAERCCSHMFGFEVFFSCCCFFLSLSNSHSQEVKGGMKGSSLGVTNVFPQHKSRTRALLCVRICICICVLTGFDTNNRITESNSILFCLFVLSVMSPVGLLSVLLVCLSVLAQRSRSGSVYSFNKRFFNSNNYFNHAPLHEFPSLLFDKMHQSSLSMAEYTCPWYPVQFLIDLCCSLPESWHTLFWWLFGSFLVFFPAKICLF